MERINKIRMIEMDKNMTRKVSTKVAAISGISALAVSGLIAFASTNTASAEDLVNPSASAPAEFNGNFGQHDGMGGHKGGDFGDKKIIDRTETFVGADGVVTIHTMSTGTVTSVDSNSVTYTNVNGDSITVSPTASTMIDRDGAKATLSDITVDDLVGVRTESVDGIETVEAIHASSTGVLASPHHGKGPQGPDSHFDKDRGQRVGSETTFEDADGNIIIQIDYDGEITAVSSSAITITLADGTSVDVEVNDATVIEKSRETATLADIVVTDLVRVDVVDGVATEIHAITAEEFANGDFGGHGPNGQHDGGMMGGGQGGHRGGGHQGH
jgi:hypothetical protein